MWSKTCNLLLWPTNTVNNADSHEQAKLFIARYPAFESLIDLDKAVQSLMAQWQAQGLSIDVNRWSQVLNSTNQAKQQCEADMGVSGLTKSEVITTLSEQLGIRVVPNFDWVKDNTPRYPVLSVFKQYLNLISQLSRNQLSDEEKKAECLRGHWNSYSTYSGRFSCTNHNLLALPSEYNSCWRPKILSNRLVGFDLSAIQLRIAGALSGDERLQASFASGIDLHTVDGNLICEWLKIPMVGELVAHKLGKRLIYALLYGGRERLIGKVIQKILGITIKSGEAYLIHGKFRMRYPKLFNYLDSLGSESGIETPFGWVPISTKLSTNQHRNLPIQMYEAVLLKQLLIGLSDEDIIMPIHDAILFEVTPTMVGKFKQHVVDVTNSRIQALIPGLVITDLIKFKEMTF